MFLALEDFKLWNLQKEEVKLYSSLRLFLFELLINFQQEPVPEDVTLRCGEENFTESLE